MTFSVKSRGDPFLKRMNENDTYGIIWLHDDTDNFTRAICSLRFEKIIL